MKRTRLIDTISSLMLAVLFLAGPLSAQDMFDFMDDAEVKETDTGAAVGEVVVEAEAETAIEAPAEEAVAAEEEEVAAEPEEPVMPEELSMNELVRRQELKLAAEQTAAEAAAKYQAGEFAEAVDHYKKARAKLMLAGRSPAILAEVKKVDAAIEGVYVDWGETQAAEAQELANVEQFDDAIDKLRKAIELDPARKAELQDRIGEYLEMKDVARFESQITEERVDVGKKERDFDVDVLLEQGKVLYKNERLMDARDKFQQVLGIDPYQITAIRYLRKISSDLDEAAEERRLASREEKIAEVTWKWSDPVRPFTAEGDRGVPGEAVAKMAESKIQEKLRQIVIPRIEFEEATIHQVVNFLKTKSKELDPEGEGVNIFLHLRQPGEEGSAPTTPAAQAPVAPPADAGWGFEGEGLGGPGFDFDTTPAAPAEPAFAGPARNTITMSMDNIELGEAIKYICLGANLRYQVETNAVVIADEEITFKELKTEFYAVKAGFFKPKKTAEAADLAGGWAATDAGEDATDVVDPDSVRTYFENLGVVFPEGSSIAYDGRTSKLIVHNTEENLQKIENVLRELNITPTQVMIEAKFVEVNQDELEGLGFSWMIEGYNSGNEDFSISPQGIPDDQIIPIIDTDAYQAYIDAGETLAEAKRLATTGYERVAPPGSTTAALNTAIRTLGGAIGSNVATDVLAVQAILGVFDLSAVVHAISQVKSSDLLSAPKVTTTSGSTAIIRMVEERYFPESWSEPEIDTTNTGGDGGSVTSIIPSTPEFGAARDIGVVLEVTPQVESDGYTIGLELRPQVIEFKGYDTSFNTTVETALGAQEFKAQMPIIEARTLETNVIVYDGETVILGGMIREQVEAFDDKVPVLGDIPILGRLFRNKGESVRKRNLLIFVTARLVDPAGQAKRRQEALGLPDFGH